MTRKEFFTLLDKVSPDDREGSIEGDVWKSSMWRSIHLCLPGGRSHFLQRYLYSRLDEFEKEIEKFKRWLSEYLRKGLKK